MKTVVLHGSPRKNRNSDTLAEYFINGLSASGDSEIQHFYTNDLNIRPCQGCLTCETSGDHRCAIKGGILRSQTTPQPALKYSLPVQEEGQVKRVDDFYDPVLASESSLGFWDNPLDDEDWNNA